MAAFLGEQARLSLSDTYQAAKTLLEDMEEYVPGLQILFDWP